MKSKFSRLERNLRSPKKMLPTLKLQIPRFNKTEDWNVCYKTKFGLSAYFRFVLLFHPPFHTPSLPPARPLKKHALTEELIALVSFEFQSWNYKLWKAEKTDQENNGKAVSVGSSPVSWLHLGISIHVLHTDLHTSRRIYLIIKSFFTSWLFPLLS